MSRYSKASDPSQCRNSDSDFRRRSAPLTVITSNHMNAAPPNTTLLSPPPTPQSRPPRSDRLSLRLRSNSGLKLHINESVLSQYIDYGSKSHTRPFNFHKRTGSSNAESIASRNGEALSPGVCSVLSPGLSLRTPLSNEWTATGLASCLRSVDFLGKDAFQMAMDNPSVNRRLIQYCEEHRCEDVVEFLMKVSLVPLGDSMRDSRSEQ